MGIEAVDTGAVEPFANESFYDEAQKVQWNEREIQGVSTSYNSKSINKRVQATMAQSTIYNNSAHPQIILTGGKASVSISRDNDGNNTAESKVETYSDDGKYAGSIETRVTQTNEGETKGEASAEVKVETDSGVSVSVKGSGGVDSQGNPSGEVRVTGTYEW